LKIQRADEPDDIIWENFGVEKSVKQYNKRKTNIMTIILLSVCFLIILGLQLIQTAVNEKRSSYSNEITSTWYVKYAFNTLMSVIIVSVNIILSKSIHSYVHLERRRSYSNYYRSVMNKLSISMFINTALIYFMINNVFLRNPIDHKSALI
jgi:predicted permease